MSDRIKVAIISSSSVFLDLAANMEKALGLIGKAAGEGAQLISFGETWLPGYPARVDYCPDAALWDHGPSKEVFARLRRNSVVVPGKETRQFAQLARDHQLTIVIGVNERVESY